MTHNSFRIYINKRQWLKVVIFDNHRQYMKKYHAMHGKSKKTIACYSIFGSRNIHSGSFGQIMFSNDHVSYGTVAHEVQHFIFDWIRTHYKRLAGWQDEYLAQLADRITAEFWTQWYKLYLKQFMPKKNK